MHFSSTKWKSTRLGNCRWVYHQGRSSGDGCLCCNHAPLSRLRLYAAAGLPQVSTPAVIALRGDGDGDDHSGTCSFGNIEADGGRVGSKSFSFIKGEGDGSGGGSSSGGGGSGGSES